uniref:FecR family protein n=1 Tax=Butyricimonas virosa TaxID=544645 RepID=UPI004027A2F8
MDIEWKKIKRVITGKASEQEKREVDAWKKGSEQREGFYEDAVSYYGRIPEGNDDLSQEEIARAWQRVRERTPKRRCVSHQIIGWIAGAAIFTGLFFGVRLLFTEPMRDVPRKVEAEGIRLVLSDGTTHTVQVEKQVALDIPGFEVNEKEGLRQLEKQQEMPDKKEDTYNEVIVPRGADYQLTLADGTRVMLNSDSRIRFPDEFEGNERRVYVRGEVYFKVAHDENCPFFVETEAMTVRVLGTEFNVKAYEGTGTATTLVSGRVGVKTKTDSLTLVPGEQCEVDEVSGRLMVREADLVTVLAWKNGEFVFKDVALKDMMNELSRWYDMEVEYELEVLKNDRYYIYVGRSKTLEEVLDKLALTGNMKYKIDGKKVIISRQ